MRSVAVAGSGSYSKSFSGAFSDSYSEGLFVGYPGFDHERLDVYRAAIQFNAWAGALLDGALSRCPLDPRKHLDEAASSIALNIAEGNGRRTQRDRCKFLDIARGSALECAACLDVLVARKVLKHEEVAEGKGLLVRISEMLYKLIQRMLPGGES